MGIDTNRSRQRLSPPPWRKSLTAWKARLLRGLVKGPGYLEHLALLATQAKVNGGMIYDGRIAALCRAHGLRELWSADRDFSRFPGVVVRNPLVTVRPRR